jgi:transcription elongation factor Elf1
MAEVNVNLVIRFECPHCDATQHTSSHGFQTEISTGQSEIQCTSCEQEFDLVINESY